MLLCHTNLPQQFYFSCGGDVAAAAALCGAGGEGECMREGGEGRGKGRGKGKGSTPSFTITSGLQRHTTASPPSGKVQDTLFLISFISVTPP